MYFHITEEMFLRFILNVYDIHIGELLVSIILLQRT